MYLGSVSQVLATAAISPLIIGADKTSSSPHQQLRIVTDTSDSVTARAKIRQVLKQEALMFLFLFHNVKFNRGEMQGCHKTDWRLTVLF